MSSLPQGWHGLSKPLKTTGPSKSSENMTALPTLRKRWNAPQVPETPKTKLPTFRKNSMPAMPNGSQTKGTPKQAVPRSTSQSKLPDFAPKPLSKTKESQIEIAALKKELATFKAENSILKARVRRVDDENNQKSRQIEKLQSEVKNEMLNGKKNKENESLLVLRQKCLRLEGALREKENAIKKLVSELKLIKVEELKDIIEKYHKELGIQNGVGGGFFRSNKLNLQPTDGSSLPKQSRTNIKDQASKSELEKLRNMIHKLETSNKNLHFQVKEKDQEIRRLKLQIHRQGSKTNVSTSGSSSRLAHRGSTPRSSSPVQSATPIINASKQSSSSHLAPRKTLKTPTTIPSVSKAENHNKQVQNKRLNSSSALATSPNSTFVVKRVQSVPKQKPTVRKSVSSTDAELVRLEQKVQNMRENVAARKIQKGWRNHRKMVNKDISEEQEKALAVIFSQLKAHQLRKDKLLSFAEETAEGVKLSEKDRENTAQKVHSYFKAVWEQTKDVS